MSVNIYNSNPNATSEEENFSRVADRGSKLASDTIYSNTTSGLNSVNVQGAIDEVNGKVEDNVEAISQINSDLTDIGTTDLIAVGGIDDSGIINHPDLSAYKAIIVSISSGSSVVSSTVCPISEWLNGNKYYVQFYEETSTRYRTAYFEKVTDTSTNLTLVSPSAYFNGWSYRIIGVK